MPPNHWKAMPVLIITVILACAGPCFAAQPDAVRLARMLLCVRAPCGGVSFARARRRP